MENIYHTIRGRTKSPRTLESNSKDPPSAAYIDICIDKYMFIFYRSTQPKKNYLNYDRMVIVCSDWHFHEKNSKWMERLIINPHLGMTTEGRIRINNIETSKGH